MTRYELHRKFADMLLEYDPHNLLGAETWKVRGTGFSFTILTIQGNIVFKGATDPFKYTALFDYDSLMTEIQFQIHFHYF